MPGRTAGASGGLAADEGLSDLPESSTGRHWRLRLLLLRRCWMRCGVVNAKKGAALAGSPQSEGQGTLGGMAVMEREVKPDVGGRASPSPS